MQNINIIIRGTILNYTEVINKRKAAEEWQPY